LFNNEVYGLTKGQASPTSRRGTVSPSTPYGSHDRPLSACELALGSGATFVARGVDTSVKQLVPIMIAAKEHKGSSFIEIYQNCVVYNDGVFNSFTERSNIANQQIHVENGKPLIFGENKDKGLIVNNKNSAFDIINLDKDKDNIDRVTVHDETNKFLAYLLTQMKEPDFPVAIGVLHRVSKPTLDQQFTKENTLNINKISQIINRGQTWTIA
jgi:2-oxoglutarate ferredoxin oxidoreductase subunit beta